MIGVTLWWLRRSDEAIATWRLGLNAGYTDAAGGVILPSLLFFASIRTDDSALRKDARVLLRKRWRTKQARSNWPGPIAALLLGHALSTQSSPYKSSQVGHSCSGQQRHKEQYPYLSGKSNSSSCLGNCCVQLLLTVYVRAVAQRECVSGDPVSTLCS
jgi:hypothetical protein